jgi:hypothetical protein
MILRFVYILRLLDGGMGQFLPSSTDVNFYRTLRDNQIAELVPQSFCRQDFSTRPHLMHFEYNPHKPQREKSKSAQTTKGTDDAANDHEEDDVDDDDAADDMGGDDGEDKPEKHIPDTGYTPYIKFDSPIPQQHPLGVHPPQWPTHALSYRGYDLLDKLQSLLKIIPGMVFLLVWCMDISFIVSFHPFPVGYCV